MNCYQMETYGGGCTFMKSWEREFERHRPPCSPSFSVQQRQPHAFLTKHTHTITLVYHHTKNQSYTISRLPGFAREGGEVREGERRGREGGMEGEGMGRRGRQGGRRSRDCGREGGGREGREGGRGGEGGRRGREGRREREGVRGLSEVVNQTTNIT